MRLKIIRGVQKKRAVARDAADSRRIWYSIKRPTSSPRSAATCSATPIAEIRRGCVHPIYIGLKYAASSSRINWGTGVVFPQPVSPETTITLLCRTASTISSRHDQAGNFLRGSVSGPAYCCRKRMFRMQEWPVRVSYPIAEPSDLSGATIRFSRAGHIRNFSHRGMRDEDSEPAQLPYRRRRVQA